MGVRVAVIVCTTSFLLGCFATHWIADSVTLWQAPLTDAHLHAAAEYYSILSTMPPWMESVFVIVGTLAATALFMSFWDGRAGNIMFDGASLFLSACALIVWVYSVFPNIERLSPRLKDLGPFPIEIKEMTLEVASKNLVCSVALTGVLLLQAGRQWAEIKEDSNDNSTSALEFEDEHASSIELESLGPSMARGRRRSHHDHLDLDNSSASTEGSNARSQSPRKRDAHRKRRGLGVGRRRSSGEHTR